MATVVDFFESGAPKIKFDGEDQPAEKEYSYLESYSPALEDRVFCMNFGESYIIMGKVNFEEPPYNLEADLKPLADRIQQNETNIETNETNIETNKTNITNITNEYLKKADLTTELNNTQIQGKGAHLICSNMTSDSNGNKNIWYMYVEPSTNQLQVRRVNGQWTTYNPA